MLGGLSWVVSRVFCVCPKMCTIHKAASYQHTFRPIASKFAPNYRTRTTRLHNIYNSQHARRWLVMMRVLLNTQITRLQSCFIEMPHRSSCVGFQMLISLRSALHKRHLSAQHLRSSATRDTTKTNDANILFVTRHEKRGAAVQMPPKMYCAFAFSAVVGWIFIRIV